MPRTIATPARSAGFNHGHARDAATIAHSSAVHTQMNHCPMNVQGWSFGCDTGSAMHIAESADPAPARHTVTQKDTPPAALAAPDEVMR